jgi:3-oxoacyl-[acyl-carrier protein] reductase
MPHNGDEHANSSHNGNGTFKTIDDATGKVALITGGCGGIGLATATLFSSKGYKVVVGDISPPADGVVLPSETWYCPLDVVKEASVKAAAEAVRDRYGRLDVLVNNAGVTCDRPFLKMTLEEFNKVIQVNLVGSFLTTQAFLPLLMESRGVVIFVGSCNSVGCPGQANYASSKAALYGLAGTITLEFTKKGVRAALLEPGYTETEMVKTVPGPVMDKILNGIPMQRLAQPEEIAFGAWMLAANPFVNGTFLRVTGGGGRLM